VNAIGAAGFGQGGIEWSSAGLALRFWPTPFFGRLRGARFCCYFAVLSKITGIDLFHVLISVFTATAAMHERKMASGLPKVLAMTLGRASARHIPKND
jgi:hypothetical protein